jgi:hypothetical protein
MGIAKQNAPAMEQARQNLHSTGLGHKGIAIIQFTFHHAPIIQQNLRQNYPGSDINGKT